jgi:hypothetical protein
MLGLNTQNGKGLDRTTMNTTIVKCSAIVFAAVAVLVLASCSSAPKGEGSLVAAYQEGVPGGVVVQTTQTSATVTGIDAATRRVTLVTRDGKKTVFKAGPEVANFAQIQIGDQIRVTLVEELVVFLRAQGEPADDGQAGAVALAPIGAKPGVLMADTVQVTAKVTAIDLKRHRATLQFPDGTTRTITVRKDVDLTKRSVGEDVVVRSTEALAIMVEKP